MCMIKGKKTFLILRVFWLMCIIDERLPQNSAFVIKMIIGKGCFALKFHHHPFMQQITKGVLFIHDLSSVKMNVSDS